MMKIIKQTENSNSASGKIFAKADICIFAAILLFAAISLLIVRSVNRRAPAIVEISVDGQVFGTYPLNIDTAIDVPGYTGGMVHVTISDRTAYVTEADCPNQICVNHAPISQTGETIVCLPNRVIVTIRGTSQDVDAIAQ